MTPERLAEIYEDIACWLPAEEDYQLRELIAAVPVRDEEIIEAANRVLACRNGCLKSEVYGVDWTKEMHYDDIEQLANFAIKIITQPLPAPPKEQA